jgi:hypothetical protein
MVRWAPAAAARLMAACQNSAIAGRPWMGRIPSAMSWACSV